MAYFDEPHYRDCSFRFLNCTSALRCTQPSRRVRSHLPFLYSSDRRSTTAFYFSLNNLFCYYFFFVNFIFIVSSTRSTPQTRTHTQIHTRTTYLQLERQFSYYCSSKLRTLESYTCLKIERASHSKCQDRKMTSRLHNAGVFGKGLSYLPSRPL